MIDPAHLEFVPLRDVAHLGPYHDIRRTELFERYDPGVLYRPGPDEDRPNHLPHVLLLAGEVVGTMRIDLIDRERAGFRLVAVKGDLKSQGLGAVLLQRSEAIVRAYDRRSIVVNASLPAANFYRRHGYTEGDWTDVLRFDARTQVRLGKKM